MHIAGLAGMARRIPEYSDIFIPSVTVGTTGSFLLIFSVLILLRSMLMTWTNVIYANYR
jgi:heme/copper-type cytochrome/quinol oxidase subunit 1